MRNEKVGLLSNSSTEYFREVLASATMQEKEKKRHKYWKGLN